VLRDPERDLATVEDQRHHDILFVVEMTDQPLEQRAARLRVGFAAAAQPIGLARERPHRLDRGVGGTLHIVMDGGTLAFQNFKAERQTVIGAAEVREIVQVPMW